MLEFVNLISDFWSSVLGLFDRYPIKIGDYEISLIWLIFAFLVVGMVVSYYWKGART